MSESQTPSTSERPEDPGLHRVVLDDLRRTELRRDYLREFKDLYTFYLDHERRAQLQAMGRLNRAFSLLWWTLKSLLLKLSPTRRLLLVLAILIAIPGPQTFSSKRLDLTVDFRLTSLVLVLFVLMLELRDKLLARDEIDVARQVQLALLPRTHPLIPGWAVWSFTRPANDVGGDLVDYVEIDGFREAVVLGDVAGKGLGAALLSAKLQATLRALLPASASLDDLGARVNAIFHRDGLDNRFATLFLAQLEHDSTQLRYLNAGHNPPLLIRRDRVERLPASSYPLGLLASACYLEGAVELQPGDVMLAYSDGLTEAQNAAGEEFGIDRLERLAVGLRNQAPEVIGSRIAAEVDCFTGATRLADDLSLAVIVKR